MRTSCPPASRRFAAGCADAGGSGRRPAAGGAQGIHNRPLPTATGSMTIGNAGRAKGNSADKR